MFRSAIHRLTKKLADFLAPKEESTAPPAPSDSASPTHDSLVPSRQVTIAHESGHALVSWLSPYVATVEVVTIFVPMGMKFEVMPELERHGYVSHFIEQKSLAGRCAYAVVLMGGLAAELTMLGKFRTGNSRTDLMQAAAVLRQAIQGHGIKSVLREISETWHCNTDIGTDFGLYMPATEPEVIKAINHAFAVAWAQLSENFDMYMRLHTALGEREVMHHADLATVLGARPWCIVNHRRN